MLDEALYVAIECALGDAGFLRPFLGRHTKEHDGPDHFVGALFSGRAQQLNLLPVVRWGTTLPSPIRHRTLTSRQIGVGIIDQVYPTDNQPLARTFVEAPTLSARWNAPYVSSMLWLSLYSVSALT